MLKVKQNDQQPLNVQQDIQNNDWQIRDDTKYIDQLSRQLLRVQK